MTFVILTHNDERVFALLDQLKGEEVLVIDDESNLEYIGRVSAHRSHPKIEQRRLLLDFSEQRNYANQIVGYGKWIFMVDSDETFEFSPSSLSEIANQISGFDTIVIQRRNVFYHEDGSRNESFETHRRGYRNTGARWVSKVHETLPCNLSDLNTSLTLRHEKTFKRERDQRGFYELLKSKILLSYAVSYGLRDSFLKVQTIQPKIPEGVYQLVVSDRDMDIGDQFLKLVDPEIGDGESFNLSRQRNATIDYAIRNNYDWIVILDSDAIVVDIKEMPISGYGTSWVWWGGENEVSIDQVKWNLRDRWSERSWFILGRELFTKTWCRFDEEYRGAWHQDWDFHEHVVCRNGVERTKSDVRAVHVWHPPRGQATKENADRFNRKREEYALAKAQGT